MSIIDNYLIEAHDAHTVESSVRTLTVSGLITEIVDKLNTYEKKVFVGRYTYIIFADCKYILNNNFFNNKILPQWKMITKFKRTVRRRINRLENEISNAAAVCFGSPRDAQITNGSSKILLVSDKGKEAGFKYLCDSKTNEISKLQTLLKN